MGFDNENDEGLEFDEDLEEDLDDELDEIPSDIPTRDINSKTPVQRYKSESKKISVYFNSLIGPEKKQKLSIKTGNIVGDIKETVANLFGLQSTDFHLSLDGITLNETSRLVDYNVADGDDILLIPASIAGL